MKVLLITPNVKGIYSKPSTPPVGIGYLAGSLKQAGHSVEAMDLRVEKNNFDYLSKIKEIHPDFIGISMMSSGYKHSYALVNKIKKNIAAKVVIGGPHPSTVKEKALEECLADYAVLGEGEETLSELLSTDAPSKVKGLAWRNKGQVTVNPGRELISDLDTLPFPDYELFKLDSYAQKRIPLATARGCPHRCVYCSVDLLIGKKFRPRSPKNVADEIELWYKKGYVNFGVNDDTFTENIERAGRICDEIISRNLAINWDLRTGIRVDRVNKELLFKLKKAGCSFIAFGIESVDPKVLEMMRKDIKNGAIEKAVKLTKECGIGVGGFFMIGTPADTYETFRKTYRFASLDYFDEVRFYNTEPYPGTMIFDWIKENGRFLSQPEEYLNSHSRWKEDPIFETDDFPKDKRKRAFNEGEYLVAKKLVIKVFGKKAGFLFYLPCKIKIFRKLMLGIGFSLAPLIFKCLDLKNRDKP